MSPDWLIPVGGIILFLFLWRQVQAPGGSGTRPLPNSAELEAELKAHNIPIPSLRELPSSPLGTIQSFPLRDGAICFSPAAREHMGTDLWVLAAIAVAVHRGRRRVLIHQFLRPLCVAALAGGVSYAAAQAGAAPGVPVAILFGALLFLIPYQRSGMRDLQGWVDRLSAELVGDPERAYRALARRVVLNHRLRTKPDERSDVLGARRLAVFGMHTGLSVERRKALQAEIES